MKSKITVLSLFIAFAINAQIIKPNHENVRIPDLKNKTIYFVLTDANNFLGITSKTWLCCHI
ncbi:MAG TPA: hypothetical protein VF411_08955 [Bacteroidia bacterium]